MLWTYILVTVVGVMVGFINTLTGSGSLIMVPLLMSMGLPPHIANGTNRIAVVVQTFTGTSALRSSGETISGRQAWLSVGIGVVGALLGAWIVTQIDPNLLKDIIGALLVVMLGIIFIKPSRWLREASEPATGRRLYIGYGLMFLVGMYGGFIQGGVGIFLLATMVLVLRYSMRQANVLKLWVVLIYAIPVACIFIWQGQVDWFWAIFTSVGQSVGAYIGAVFLTRFKSASLWTYRLLLVVLLGTVIQFYELWRFVL